MGGEIMQVNPKAIEKVTQLIDEGKFRISTPWREVKPSNAAEDRFIERHGWGKFGEWYLAVNTDADKSSKEHYQLPIGDFNAVHRSGLVAAKQRAAQENLSDVEAAADELLFLFDRINAC
jgi:hypothetical protein